MSKRFIAALAGLLVVLAWATPVSAQRITDGRAVSLGNQGVTPLTTEYAGGGIWSYGTEVCWQGKGAYSQYWHPVLYHSATAIVGNDHRTAYANGNAWAEAHACGLPWEDAYSYWNTYE